MIFLRPAFHRRGHVNQDPHIFAPIREIGEHLVILVVSGIGGAFFRAIIAPEAEWKRRVVQGIVGALSAVFLGGLLAQFIEAMVSAGVWAYLASGFLMGSGGEVAVKAIQDRVLGKR